MSDAGRDQADQPAVGLDHVQREAVAWAQRLLSGEATPDDARELRRWRARSPAHAAALARAGRVWGDIGMAGDRLYHRQDVSAFRQAQMRRAIGRRAVLGGAIASAVATYAVIRPPLGMWPSLAELAGDYRTGRGEQRQVTLPHQVSVTLNTQTSIALDAHDTAVDRVELINGEAAFATSPGAGRTLAVLVAGVTATASNARFDVRHLAEASVVRVTCLDGQVRIERAGEARQLERGEQIRCNRRGFGAVATVDPQVEAAWQRGIVIFQATPLEEVVEEINRYRPGKIVLINQALAQKPVSGRFRIDQLSDILVQLEQAFGARVRFLPGGVALLS
jgi:transmembrane sensor